MRKVVMIALVAVLAGGAAFYFGLFSREQTAAAAGGQGQPRRRSGGRAGSGPAAAVVVAARWAAVASAADSARRSPCRSGPRPRATIGATMTVVGNLIGQQTVDVVPRTGGRLVTVNVQLGDAVRRGQLLAKLEDFEIVEQVKQAEASLEVARATIRQREADLKVAELNFDRSKNLFQRQLLAKQALDDAESRYMAAEAQIDLSKAQAQQTSARLEELQINLGNTTIISPVDGFVGKRNADPGAWVSQNARWSRWSRFRACGSWPTSSRRICGS